MSRTLLTSPRINLDELFPDDEPESLRLKAFYKYSRDGWAFWEDLVWTFDPTHPGPPRSAPDYDYLRLMYSLWSTQRLLGIKKSRRMVQSWFFVAMNLHLTMFDENQLTFFASRKEENSDELVRRAKFILDHLPMDKLGVVPRYRYKYCHLAFPDLGSEIVGVPEGSDQLRQFGASSVLCDEIAFWKNAQRAFDSMIPIVEGAGRLTLLSSVQPGFMYQFCEDLMDYAGARIRGSGTEG